MSFGSSGLDTHHSFTRSIEKLTSGGMAFLDTDIMQILEQKLPKKFGGGPTDYQLREDETPERKSPALSCCPPAVRFPG